LLKRQLASRRYSALIRRKRSSLFSNQYTEIILRTLGRLWVPPASSEAGRVRDDEENGLEVVKTFLRQAGVNDNDVALNDGSGLSRNDLISANSTIQLLTFMSKHKYFSQFREALPIAGVDGTLRTRMRGTPAEGNVRAKTGSLSSVASCRLCYDCRRRAPGFSMMLNNYPDAAAVRRDSIDAIAVPLARLRVRRTGICRKPERREGPIYRLV
jgi:D-alanyl-D-alanine carboxypeptidase/D-alanyl-D-alanine-endopeptidase (penicillin-binding protein 4)